VGSMSRRLIFVDEVLRGNQVPGFLSVDRSRLNESHDGWIYVSISDQPNEPPVSFSGGSDLGTTASGAQWRDRLRSFTHTRSSIHNIRLWPLERRSHLVVRSGFHGTARFREVGDFQCPNSGKNGSSNPIGPAHTLKFCADW